MKAIVLTERYLNLLSTEDKRKYLDKIWEILQRSYAKIGGYQGAASAEELLTHPGIWKLVRRDGEITAIGIYRDQSGRKSIAAGTNGTKQGLRDLMALKKEDLAMRRAWAEVSDRMEKLMLDLGARKIPNKYAEALVKKPILKLNDDGYHYTRLIGGEPHEKLIVGFPAVDDDIARELNVDIKPL